MKLSTRITIVMGLVVLFSGVISGLLSIKTLQEEMHTEQHKWARLLTSSLAESLAADTINGNVISAQQILHRVRDSSSNIEHMYIVDFDGNVFAHTFKSGFPEQLRKHTQNAHDYIAVTLDDLELEEIAIPLIEGMDATLQIGVNKKTLNQAISASIRRSIILYSLIGAFAIAISYLMSRRISKPLEQLDSNMRDYAASGSSRKVNIKSGIQEANNLGLTFNNVIDSREAAEKELNQFKTTLDMTKDCVFMFTVDTLTFFYVNQGALSQVGYSVDELMQMGPVDIKPDVTEEQFQEMISPLLSGEKTVLQFETVHGHKDGHRIPVDIMLQYIRPEGESARFVAIVRDISERKKVDAELDKYRGQLEKLVEERTRELRDTQDELVRKGRLATLGQLTATVSHELRNPLGAMRPSLFIIEKKTAALNDEKLNMAVERVERNIARCDRIIDELLDFTRITDLDVMPVEFDAWISGLVNEQMISPDIHLIIELGLGNTTVPLDPSRFRRAFINVFENAAQALLKTDNSDEVIKNASLTVKTVKDNDRVTLSIIDNGYGIPDDVMERIFEPLFSTKGFGVGLGMPTVKQIMEQHKGDIEIASEQSKGSTVSLWLPLSVKNEVAA